MTTKDVVEAILYKNPNDARYLKAIHVLNDTDRNWKPKMHDEYPFIKHFNNPYYLVVISRQIHVYIIGEKFKRSEYHVLNLEGFNADHMILSKNELKSTVKATIKEHVYLPEPSNERIIFIKNKQLFIFNRTSYRRDMYSKSDWTFGIDIYDVNAPKYKTSAGDIMNHICDEF